MAVFSLTVGCGAGPYVPDEDAMLFLSAAPSTLTAGESAVVYVVGQKGSGYPLPDGTEVYLTVDHGEIERWVRLQGGEAEARYRSDEMYAGLVAVTARSGRASVTPDPLTLSVDAPAAIDVAYLYAAADPAHLPVAGGRSDIEAIALDARMAPMEGENLWLETSAGCLTGGGLQTTDGTGRVHATLDTDRTATVTVRHKTLSATVRVTVGEED